MVTKTFSLIRKYANKESRELGYYDIFKMRPSSFIAKSQRHAGWKGRTSRLWRPWGREKTGRCQKQLHFFLHSQQKMAAILQHDFRRRQQRPLTSLLAINSVCKDVTWLYILEFIIPDTFALMCIPEVSKAAPYRLCSIGPKDGAESDLLHKCPQGLKDLWTYYYAPSLGH